MQKRTSFSSCSKILKEHLCESVMNLGQWFWRNWCLKAYSTLALPDYWTSFLAEQNYLNVFGRAYYEEHFCIFFLNLDWWFRRRCRFKDISNLYFWLPFYSIVQVGLCNYGREHNEKHFCEITLNLDNWFRRCHFKIFLCSDTHFVWQSWTICAILFEGIMRNISVKLFCIWTGGLGGNVV